MLVLTLTFLYFFAIIGYCSSAYNTSFTIAEDARMEHNDLSKHSPMPLFIVMVTFMVVFCGLLSLWLILVYGGIIALQGPALGIWLGGCTVYALVIYVILKKMYDLAIKVASKH